MNDVEVLIVGAGISGLALGWQLARTGVNVAIWEQDNRVGGKIRSHRDQGYLTEQAAAMVLNFRPEVSRFISAAGLDSEKTSRPAKVGRYLVDHGRLIEVPMRIGPLLKSPIWSTRGKLRMLKEPFIGRGGHDAESVSEFIRRRLGDELLDKAMEPFVAGTLANDPDLACARAVLPRLTALEQRYGSFTLGMLAHRILRRRTATVTEAFSFRTGMGHLSEALAAGFGKRLRTGYTVCSLDRRGDAWQISARTNSGERVIKARHIVLSAPAAIAAGLLAPLDKDLSKLLRGIDYAPLSIVHLGFTRSVVQHDLEGTGFLVPRRENLALNGCLWPSSLFPNRAPPDGVLLSTYLGGARRPEAAAWDNNRSTDEVLRGLQTLFGISSDPEMVRIDRHRQALPLYYGAYQARMRAIEERLRGLPGLHLEANYRGGVSVRDRIVRGLAAATRIMAALRSPALSYVPSLDTRVPAVADN